MTKVTITASAEGNESAAISARAGMVMNAAIGAQEDEPGWARSGPLYDKKKAAYLALEALVEASSDARTPAITAALVASAQADGEHKFDGLLHDLALTEPYRSLRQAVIDTWAWFSASTIFDNTPGREGGEDIYNAADAAADGAVKALLDYSPSSVAEIADKMALFERIDHIGDHEDYASILRDLRRLAMPSAPSDPTSPPASLITPGHAVSPALAGAKTPLAASDLTAGRGENGAWAAADATRTRLREKLEALADLDDDLPPEDDQELIRAQAAFIREPAPDLEAALRKAEQELIDHCAVHTIEEALAQLDEGDIHAAWKASVYRDLKQLAWSAQWAEGYPLSEKLAADLPLLNDIEESLKVLTKAREARDGAAANALYAEHDKILDRILPTRAQTMAALASKVTMIEALGTELTAAPDEDLDLDQKIVRSLLEDVKAMFKAPEVTITGSKACTALWTAGAIHARHANSDRLLAAE